ncbi:choline transport protein [Penicillium citrinum]|uniref:Choline transport protein n=2 Tax=Penicillium TaxID=5073 RepID=A0A9W9TL95_PENCI|nr:choline transport protein [Penicillium citrinum]KAJ5226971.1 choline transport protein [Penicillium citrinum]KAJ5568573.1 choline transport protein [Penicillium hetheringtonii]
MYTQEMKRANATDMRHVVDHPSISTREIDDAELARMGKRPVLKRNFGLWSILGFSCTILITWEGIVVLFLQAYQNGGPAGAVYGFIFVWIGVASTFVVLSELASMAPTSGGQYHWCSMFAPKAAMKISSYLTGWLTVIGWQATFATSCYLVGTLIQGLIALTHGSYQPQNWHGTLLFWAVAVFSLVINLIGGTLLPRFEGLILVLHLIGFFAILIPLITTANHGSAKEVFTHFLNLGGFPSQGLSFFVGMVGCMFAFAGGDAAVHMSEEITNASTAVPASIMLSVLINGSLGFGMLIAMLFCLGDIELALESPTGYPFMSIFLQATGSVAGTAVMGSIITTMGISTSVGMLATTSRQFWSFARDRGIPGWRIWSQVHGKNAVPVYSILLTTSIACLLALINIGSSVAFNDLVAMSISGLYLSYMTVAGLLLYRRCTGEIGHSTESNSEMVNTAGARLVWGPFHLPGVWGVLVNTFALIYMSIAVFFSFWPPSWVVTVDTMNFSVVGTFGVILLSLIYYVLRARRIYDGPIVEFRYSEETFAEGE